MIKKQVEESYKIESNLDMLDSNFHIEKIGKLVEAVENNIRGSLDEIYLKKTKDVYNNYNLIILLYKKYLDSW